MFYWISHLKQHLFFEEDPRSHGCRGTVSEVEYIPGDPEWYEFPPLGAVSDVCLGESPDKKCYQVFKTPKDCQKADYIPLGHNFNHYQNWGQYKPRD